MLGSPAVRQLARLKFVGFWRRAGRRLRSPKGVVFTLLGLGAIGLWVSSFVFSSQRGGRAPFEPAVLQLVVGGGLFVLTLISLSNALSFRGLYIHPSEIETLFASPLSRSDLIRLRLGANLVRSLVGALIFAVAIGRRAPHPAFGALGSAAAMLTLPILAQGLSIVAGDAESRLWKRISKLPLRRITLLLVFAVAFGVFQLARGFDLDLRDDGLLQHITEHPLVRALLAPFTPWVRTILAPDLAAFLPWFAACLVLLFGSFELVARLRVDFRELSLETSANVAKRLARLRRGVTTGEAAGHARTWSAPWLFGRGPAGAVAWRKLVSMVRKAGMSLVIGVLVTFAVATLAVHLGRADSEAWLPALLVAVVGTFYLSSGLRNDFREDLDAMASIKSWPVQPWKLFLATILPEALLVSALILAGVVGVTVYGGKFDAIVLVVCALVPLVVLTWVAIDNAVFLFAPTRFVPGQDTALQNIGRSLSLFLVRMVAIAAVVLVAALPTIVLAQVLDLEVRTALALGGAIGAFVLALEVGALAWLGGWMLRRFDVATER